MNKTYHVLKVHIFHLFPFTYSHFIGDIYFFQVDLLVNTVGCDLDLANGVVSKTILTKAGNEIQNECWKRHNNGVQFGTVVTTSPGKMRNCQNICHGVLTEWYHRTDLSLQVQY